MVEELNFIFEGWQYFLVGCKGCGHGQWNVGYSEDVKEFVYQCSVCGRCVYHSEIELQKIVNTKKQAVYGVGVK